MREDGIVINTARGNLIDEDALINALKNKTIAGAGLDVFDPEPLPEDHPFFSLENVVLTPHLGYVTEEVYRVFYGETLENILDFLKQTPKRVLNPDVLKKLRPR